MKNYTDLACELACSNFKTEITKLDFGCYSEYVKIDSAKKSAFYNKPKGEYFTLSCENLFNTSKIVCDYLSNQLSTYLKEKFVKLTGKNKNKILVACLGNDNIVCDSLGKEVFNRLIVGEAQSFNTLYAINPNVYGNTNIKSVDYIFAITKKIKPDICVIIDALCSQSISRLASCVQVSDSGILAGGAVSRSNATLISKKTLGVPTLCIGVPLCVRIESLFNDFFDTLTTLENFDEEGYYFKYKNVIVTPKNIDFLVNQSAKLIAGALNKSILNLTKKEQELFTF